MATWSSQGSATYIFDCRFLRSNRGRKASWINLWRRSRAWLFAPLHALPDLSMTTSHVAQAQLTILEALWDWTGLVGLSKEHHTPWGELALYRAAAADKKATAIREEADATHRRFLFAQGVALACMLLAVQCLARLALWAIWLARALPVWTGDPNWDAVFGQRIVFPAMAPLPFIHPIALVLLFAFGVAASSGLRWVAGRWWESEFALTCMLLREVREKERLKENAEQQARAAGAVAGPVGGQGAATGPAEIAEAAGKDIIVKIIIRNGSADEGDGA